MSIATKKANTNAASLAATKPGLFTLAALATYLGMSRNHVRRLVNAGRLPPPFYASERRPLWRAEAIEEWIREREAERDAQAQ